MYHFYICMDIHNTCENADGIKVWADYLFSILDGVPEDVQFSIPEEDIRQKMVSSAHEDIVLEEDDGIYERGDRFKSFHHQAKYPMSQKTLLAGFLSVWLKKCVVSSPPHDEILLWVLLLVVQLIHGKPLGLLPAMVCRFNVVFGR